MERKIGEIFEYKGEWYQCVESPDCALCAFNETDCNDIDIGDCANYKRSDGKSVIFKKLEKVGEPYNIGTHIFQRYKVFIKPYIFNDSYFTVNPAIDDEFIGIEVKQNQEDMEENHKAEDTLLTRLVGRYVNNLIDYETFEKMVKQLYSAKKDSKPTLKEFDLEAAKAGKPVCTRDGRKARIICFDRKLFYQNVSYPILALVERSDGEDDVCGYNEKGKVLIEDGAEYKDDLMILPEWKEMWINIYKGTTGIVPGGCLYDTEEEAKDAVKGDEIYVTTTKVCWEE